MRATPPLIFRRAISLRALPCCRAAASSTRRYAIDAYAVELLIATPPVLPARTRRYARRYAAIAARYCSFSILLSLDYAADATIRRRAMLPQAYL